MQRVAIKLLYDIYKRLIQYASFQAYNNPE